jgi:predicted transcriptional regulator
MAKIPTTVTIDPTLKQQACEFGKQQDRSVSWIVNQALRDYLLATDAPAETATTT